MAFPEPHIVNPQHPQQHIHTAIVLHGYTVAGATASSSQMISSLFSSNTSRGTNLAASLPTWRWVFSTSRERSSTTFQEDMCARFDVRSLSDPAERQELQVEGLRESVSYVTGIVERELEILGNRKGRVFLGGISQGMATGLRTLFCLPGSTGSRLGGFLGMCGWLPFAREVEDAGRGDGKDEERQRKDTDTFGFCFKKLFGSDGLDTADAGAAILSAPVFLAHGTDDVWVSVGLGRQAKSVLKETMAMPVEWVEITGAENDGHWVKEPEGFDRILQFLETNQTSRGRSSCRVYNKI
ncbi:Alpha/Beta hydrolase protein [Aspergillus aurantiobrunneus]